ncbi:hypothetical protein AOQ73_05670 [Bradyrhizobium pachyrhizi]|uniref:hypothetical protein n=1 Tax=Bradyrhizobium pachyrhizi TaxID=280333 RepID=UPI000704FAE4|nr:hypothetical protein [Bradyrhizobium pachyrhizi]KRQ11895.1 hypothetical protein AOQ73_05670 [Bradyrhizobium pachyrhizi]
MIRCDACNAPTTEPENEYGEFICKDCAQDRAEAAWERHCDALHGGGGPLPLREQQIAALRLK